MRVLDEGRLAECTVAVTCDRQSATETARAFDAVAGDYDRTNRENPILSHMRGRALQVLRERVARGSKVIDLGCGPGTDHEVMRADGYRLTAVDASPEMVRQAQRRAAAAGGPDRPTILCCSIDQLATFGRGAFDAAFSNFGPLNCVPDLEGAAGRIREVLRPGGLLVASVIGRWCPWEIALYLSKGDLGRAFLRFRRGMVPVPLRSGRIWTQYFTPQQFARAFAAKGFRRCDLRGLGVIAPPPYLEAFAARHPSVVSLLLEWDATIGRWPLARQAGDHFLIVLQRD
ncbi:MAG TPA: methyltransferase domain-containing protein [Vicinamibacterales bacterium]|nr:methyltransferase domain-containing protein [Vicinamibacterales bacterium]